MIQSNFKYSIHVYEDHAQINGGLPSHVLILLIKLCKKEGFDIMTYGPNGGFRLIRKLKEKND